jgi:hypothetical protein
MKLRNELRNVCRETPPKTSKPLTTHKKQAIPNKALTVSKFVVAYATKPLHGLSGQLHALAALTREKVAVLLESRFDVSQR